MKKINVQKYAANLRNVILMGQDIGTILSIHDQVNETLLFLRKYTFKNTLPPPDRFAYRFLHSLNLLDSRFIGYQKKTVDTFPWVKFYNYFQKYLRQKGSKDSAESIREHIRSLLPPWVEDPASSVETGPKKQKILTSLRFFLHPERLEAMAINHAYFRETFPQKQCSYTYTSFLWKAKKNRADENLQINHAMGTFSPEKTGDFLQRILRQDPSVRNRIIEDPEFTENDRKLKSIPQEERKGKGIFRDLETLMNEVMAEYFPEMDSKPTIFWSDHFSVRKLAHYDFSRDSIVVSLIFDLPESEPEILKFLIYHELAHRKFGVKIRKEKILAHTKQFKDFEKQYPNFAKIDKNLSLYASAKFITVP